MARFKYLGSKSFRIFVSDTMHSITLRFLATPETVNFGGKVHGGTVMKWIDEAAYACATAFAKRYCVTVFVGGIRFVRPIVIGDLVEVEATVAYTGKKSINIAVQVRSGDLKEMNLERTTECAVVFVSVDSHGQSVATLPYRALGEVGTDLIRRVEKMLVHQDTSEAILKADVNNTS
jgi:acyl-CoA hydrolase